MEKWYKYMLLCFSVLIFVCEPTYSQHNTVKTDTTFLYKKIENYSNKSKLTKIAYSLVFKSYTVKPRKKRPIQKPYRSFEGKIIRRIAIETLDPFGNTLEESAITPMGSFSKFGNSLHLKTHEQTIRNLLLIQPNQPFDSLLVKESERLVRNRSYIRDVSFFVKASAIPSDSVDITIRVLDNWSFAPDVEASMSTTTVNLTEKNLFGMGHEYLNGFTRDIPMGIYTYRTNYEIPNISNTFISAAVHFEKDENDNFNKSIIIDRPFYSSFAKWAGGISLKDERSMQSLLNFRSNTQDFWVGQSQQLSVGKSVEKRLTNFITTTRYLRVRYQHRPTDVQDPFHLYSNEDFFLTGIGLSNRTYIQDKYLFKYGITEDVPIGKLYAASGGYQVKNNVGRPFLSLRFSEGNYYPWGYLSSNISYETFFRGSDTEEGFVSADLKFFTELLEVGKWKFRQFVKPEISIGINRLGYDSLTLNSGFGIDGFQSNRLSGNSRFLLSLQTQAYAPWDFIGFRFGPFFTYTLGYLGTTETGFKTSKPYSQFGFGIMIKNENLILNTFQFSFSFFPVMPGNGQNVLKMNSFRTTDFGFSNFEVGKPGTRVFQ